MKKKKINKFPCKDCGSSQTYALKDGTRVCRKCAYREKSKEKKING